MIGGVLNWNVPIYYAYVFLLRSLGLCNCFFLFCGFFFRGYDMLGFMTWRKSL